MAWDTAANILNDAAVELGLISTELADPYDEASDPNIIQLRRFLKGLGQDLARDYPWSHLEKEHTFNTANGTASYALPTDFARIVDGTAWNRTQTQQMLGPINSQQWQYLKGGNHSITSPAAFRIFGDLFYIHTTPTAIEAIYYEYQSKYWVDLGGGIVPDSETPTDGTDSILFERRMMVAGLKLYFLRAKGFDVTNAQQDFNEALRRAQAGDGAAPVLSLTGSSGVHLIDHHNLPDTGWGS